MAKLVAPTAEWVSIGGENRLVFGDAKLIAIYSFLSQLAEEFNKLIADDVDPSTSPLSYVDHLIIKLKLCQPFFPSGTYLDVHVAPAHLETFIARMKVETRWRIANGEDTPSKSWFLKGGVLNLPDARGLFPRFWSDTAGTDPDGWSRQLGAFQDSAMQRLTGTMGDLMQWGRNNASDGVFVKTAGNTEAPRGNGANGYSTLSFDNARQALTASENRPKNLTVLRLILT